MLKMSVKQEVINHLRDGKWQDGEALPLWELTDIVEVYLLDNDIEFSRVDLEKFLRGICKIVTRTGKDYTDYAVFKIYV